MVTAISVSDKETSPSSIIARWQNLSQSLVQSETPSIQSAKAQSIIQQTRNAELPDTGQWVLQHMEQQIQQIVGMAQKIQQAIDKGDTATLALLTNTAQRMLSVLKPDEAGYDIHPKPTEINNKVNNPNPNMGSWLAVLGWASSGVNQWQDTRAMINDVSTTYQKAFAQATSVYTQFFTQYAEKVTQKFDDQQQIDNAAGKNKAPWHEELAEVLHRFNDNWRDNLTRDRVLWPVQSESGGSIHTGSKNDAHKWAKVFGLNEKNSVQSLHNSSENHQGWIVKVDTQPLETLASSSAKAFSELQKSQAQTAQSIKNAGQIIQQKQQQADNVLNNLENILFTTLAASVEDARHAAGK